MLLENGKSKIITLIGFVFLSSLSFIGGYKAYTRPGDILLSTVKANGTLIYENNERRVFYLDNKLYFVTDSNSDNAYEYFLRFYPVNSETIDSNFEYKTVALPTSLFNERIAEMNIPIKNFSKVEFGQQYCRTRLWEKTLDLKDYLECPKEIVLSCMTNEKWESGHGRSENVLLIENDKQENYVLIGKYLISPNGERYLITNVEQVPGYSLIFTQEHLDDYSIDMYRVSN